LAASAGAGLSFRDVPASNGTTITLSILEIVNTVAVDLTERLSAGATLMLGTAGLDAPFVGIGAYAYDYALRGTVGLNYDLGAGIDLGCYYQTTQDFNFDDAIRLELGDGSFDVVQDIDFGLPDNIGLGIANGCLMDGKLLLAADVLFKQWDNADLMRAVYDNQWVFQVGAQYAWTPRVRYRVGYAYAQNPIDPDPGSSAGGVTPPGARAAIEYLQGTLAVVNNHRISGGMGIRDVLPGLDLDLMAGGMFDANQQLGPFTRTSVESYWIATGFTWRFGRGACRRLPLPDDWYSCR
jgi:long-chain fatty acid transport protein